MDPRTYQKIERLIPTPNDWHPAVFVIEATTPNATHETPLDQANMAWETMNVMGAFDGREADQYAKAAYVRGAVMRFREFCEHKGHEEEFSVRVCFWGDDDTGLELDVYFKTLEDADEAWIRWTAWLSRLAYASYWDLKKVGFTTA